MNNFLSSKSLKGCFLAFMGILAAVLPSGAQTAGSPINLSWDDGATAAGTLSVSQPSTAPGRYYYRINARSTDVWRTSLKVTAGEANLFLLKATVPLTNVMASRASVLTGSDGIVLARSEFAPGEDWYIAVESTAPSSSWTLVTGNVFVQDLGNLPYTDSNGDGSYTIGEPSQDGGVPTRTMGPEGVAFFKVTLPSNVPAWALWANGASNTLGVRRNQLPVLFTTAQLADRKQAGNLLLVPPYLGQGSDSYFVSILAVPGASYRLDSRIQQIENIAFDGTTLPMNSAGTAPYRVFRVEVPAEQVIWDIALDRRAGNPNLAVKKQTVPNETDNTALSDAAGAVNDSVTLVSPELTNGIWFITVYSDAAFEASLSSGTPVITDIGYRATAVNNQPNRSGWKYYRVPDVASQLGTLGWQLKLTGAPVGTEIAIRRNLAPGIWSYRTGGSQASTVVKYADSSSATGLLQRVDHEPDIWYVGVYQPTLALGAFTLTLSDIAASVGSFDGWSATEVEQIEGEWRYYRINVPANAALLGWYLDLLNVTGTAAPRITVRRDRLPPGTSQLTPAAADWPSGAAWSQDLDFTGASLNSDTRAVNGQQFLAATGVERPLQAGTYYVGVLAGSAVPAGGPVKTAGYTLRSRGIGAGFAIGVTPLDYTNGAAVIEDLAPRGFRFFSFTIPTGAQIPSSRIHLTPSTGEMFFQIRRDSLPDFSISFPANAAGVSAESPSAVVMGGKRAKRPGAEELTILSDTGQDFLQPGTYYAVVVSEGVNPGTNSLGAVPSSGTLTVTQPVAAIPVNLTTPSPDVRPFSLPAGSLAIYSVTLPPGAQMLEAHISDKVGNPGISVFRGSRAPKPYTAGTVQENYGWTGGQTGGVANQSIATLFDLTGTTYTVVVRANPVGITWPVSSGNLNLQYFTSEWPICGAQGNVAGPCDFSVAKTGQVPESWRFYRLRIPGHASWQGYHVNLENVTAGSPRMVIRKGSTLPRDFTTTPGLTSDSMTWSDAAQLAPGLDYTNIVASSASPLTSGRGFISARSAPMAPGDYIVGVSKDALAPPAASMSYTLRLRCIGGGAGDPYPITPLAFDNRAAPQAISGLAEREHRFFSVTVPPGKTSWRLRLDAAAIPGVPASVGDGMLTVRRGRIPSFDSEFNPEVKGGARVRFVPQEDRWVLLPLIDDGLLEAGDYFIAVTSLGRDATTGRTGSGTCDLTLQSQNEQPVTAIPALQVGVDTDVLYNLAAGEVAAYEFNVPVRPVGAPYGFSIDRIQTLGTSNFSARYAPVASPGLPQPPGGGLDGYFGGRPAAFISSDISSGSIVYQAQPGRYRVIVRSAITIAGNYGPAAGILRLSLFEDDSIPTVPFDGGSLTVTNQGETAGILTYRVIIPDEPNWQAWGVRLDGLIAGVPAIYIRRDKPVDLITGLSVDSDRTDWPTEYIWTQVDDYTKLKNTLAGSTNGANVDRTQQFFVAARNKPLQPGTYYIGIDNRNTPLVSPRSFTLRTFAFGAGYTVPVQDLSLPGATAAVSITEPRMPAVYKITIPPATSAWSVGLSTIQGDFTLRVRYGSIPDPVDGLYPDSKGGVHIQKLGEERFNLLPKPGADYLQPGDYYLAAVSEGQNPSFALRNIGTGLAEATLTNYGPVAVTPLGNTTELGISQPVNLAAAEIKLYTVEVGPGINNLQFRLKNRAGDANIIVLKGGRIPSVAAAQTYGIFGGEVAGPPFRDKAIVNLGNPLPGTYTVMVQASGTSVTGYAAASALLSIDILKPANLNFTQSTNAANALSNFDARTLDDKEKHFYRVSVPAQVDGSNILGWLIRLDQGSPTVKFYKSEADFGKVPAMTMVGRSALLVAPFLTTGANWFIDVEGVGTTDYIIRSEAVTLATTAWALPGVFNALAGDSNPGEPEGAANGVNLAQDDWNFYAVDVPEQNLGLLRVALEASNGNPNVYLRHNAIPSTDHLKAGATGEPSFDFRMVSEDSEAGNFSATPSPTAKPTGLKAGRWYIGVKSEPVGSLRTSSRYRLKAHSGVVTDLDLTTAAPLTAQNLAEKDWRYYRFTIPRTGIPAEWRPLFTRLNGTPQLYIRDTLPPFSYTSLIGAAPLPNYVDWGADFKNNVLPAAYLRNPAPGTVILPVPPLRPGATYYLGFYGAAGGAFEIASSVSATRIAIESEPAYDTGIVNLTIPAGQRRILRIAVPAEATRLKFDAVQSAIGLSIKTEQGSVPPATTAAHFQNAGTFPLTYTLNEALTGNWPRTAAADYYVLLHNTTAAAITTTLTMKGKTAATEDEDNDGLLDAWERFYFANSLAQTAAADPDADGRSNLQEHADQTNPTLSSSASYNITLLTPGGSSLISPALTVHPKGSMVTLTAIPAPGDTFRQWVGGPVGIAGQTSAVLNVPVGGNITTKALFDTTLANSLDTSAPYTWSTSGAAAWYGQYDSTHDLTDAASSPVLAVGQQASMSITVAGPGTLSYWWRVSSSAGNGVLSLLMDGTVQTAPAAISGSVPWTQINKVIPAGAHTLTWRYESRGAVSGENRGQVDQVAFADSSQNYTLWKTSLFNAAEAANAAISGPDADPDNDGIRNIIEAALGTLPKVRQPGQEPLLLGAPVSAGLSRSINLTLQRASSFPSDVSLQLQGAASLSGPWVVLASKTGGAAWLNTAAATVVESPAVNGLVPVTFLHTYNAAVPDRRFYRLAAQMAP
jgi:large repetitive protein